jgi:hypothetical protein
MAVAPVRKVPGNVGRPVALLGLLIGLNSRMSRITARPMRRAAGRRRAGRRFLGGRMLGRLLAVALVVAGLKRE